MKTRPSPSRPSWFSTRETTTAAGTESTSYVRKYGNPLRKLRTYRVRRRFTAYYGKVRYGTGYQLLIPHDVDPMDVLEFVRETNLK